MSASLVRKGLELFKDDLETLQDSNSPKKGKSEKSDSTSSRNLLGTNKKGVKKQKERLTQKPNKNKVTIKGKKLKSVVEEYRKNKPKDNTTDNLYFLQLLSNSHKPHSSVVEKIMEQHRGKLAKDRPPEPVVKEEGSVFTDRDFDKFEEEYDW
ncbi:active regulator of SIRT1-like [Lingula anatina]|uniref:Active regulator of SIRT1 n=1 Tax=Lingula anatina TaxID=7574 RepID=A0A1S3HBF9_LINAN|nr:active regulator of SIRT1-like [Lingula anatina]|eukprot:XP_013383345.1 active regulator of SIRT1-like [Lingula anatina]